MWARLIVYIIYKWMNISFVCVRDTVTDCQKLLQYINSVSSAIMASLSQINLAFDPVFHTIFLEQSRFTNVILMYCEPCVHQLCTHGSHVLIIDATLQQVRHDVLIICTVAHCIAVNTMSLPPSATSIPSNRSSNASSSSNEH